MRNIAKSIGIPLLVAALVMIFMAPVVLAAPGAPGSGVNKELAAARQATAKYHDVNEAWADGYVPVTPHIPGMGAHYVNFGLMDGVFSLAQPEILLYSLTEGDGPKLVAMEYAVVGPVPGGFAGDSDVWEFHEATCHYLDGSEVPALSPADCPATNPDTGAPFDFWHPGMWFVHVWLWRGNRDGIFEPFNPNVP